MLLHYLLYSIPSVPALQSPNTSHPFFLFSQPHPFPLACALPLAIISHTPLFCSYIIHVSLFCFPCSIALHGPPLFLCTSIFYHIPLFQCSCCPRFPTPSCHHSSRFISPNRFSITHNLLFILPSIILHFSVLPSPATSSSYFLAPSSPTTSCPFLCSTITYLPFLLPVTCHLTSASDPSLPCSSITHHVLFILPVLLHHTPCPHSSCAPLVSHDVPSLLPVTCHLCISFFPAMFFHCPSPISPKCVSLSPTTSYSSFLCSSISHHIPSLVILINFPPSHLFSLHLHPVSSVLILHHLVFSFLIPHVNVSPSLPIPHDLPPSSHPALIYFISLPCPLLPSPFSSSPSTSPSQNPFSLLTFALHLQLSTFPDPASSSFTPMFLTPFPFPIIFSHLPPSPTNLCLSLTFEHLSISPLSLLAVDVPVHRRTVGLDNL